MTDDDGKLVGWICTTASPTYEFTHKGRTWRFEENGWCGPSPVRRKDGQPFKRIPHAFWEAYAAWDWEHRHR